MNYAEKVCVLLALKKLKRLCLHYYSEAESLKRILFISGSIGLGHVGRDLEITRALRKITTDVEIKWLAKDPATAYLLEAGEEMLPQASNLAHENDVLENASHAYSANLTNHLDMRMDWSANAKLVGDLVRDQQFDLVVGDKTYELLIEFVNNKNYQRFHL